MASSVACTVAAKSGFMASFGSTRAGTADFARASPAFAVEKATNRSPEPFMATLPVRARPIAARRARRSSWCGRSGASVAITMMIDPASSSRNVPSVISRPTGTPATVSCRRRPKFACTRTPRV